MDLKGQPVSQEPVVVLILFLSFAEQIFATHFLLISAKFLADQSLVVKIVCHHLLVGREDWDRLE